MFVCDWQSSLYFANVYSCIKATWHIVHFTCEISLRFLHQICLIFHGEMSHFLKRDCRGRASVRLCPSNIWRDCWVERARGPKQPHRFLSSFSLSSPKKEIYWYFWCNIFDILFYISNFDSKNIKLYYIRQTWRKILNIEIFKSLLKRIVHRVRCSSIWLENLVEGKNYNFLIYILRSFFVWHKS